MNIRSIRDCTLAVVALFIVWNGASPVLGQEQVWSDAGMAEGFDLSLGAVQAVPDSALSSVEQGQTPLD